MKLKPLLVAAPALVAVLGCAHGEAGVSDAPGSSDARGPDARGAADASCVNLCDEDHDGVPDGADQCPGTPSGERVNQVGCADSQLSPSLEETFPPYNLTWTTMGDLGRPGGMTWLYTGIQRADLFHIYWIVCDDPATPCGLSLDGAIDDPLERWQLSAADSDLPAGRLVYVNTTHILLADTSTVALTGRLTLRIADSVSAALPVSDVGALGVTARAGEHGAEIPGTGFTVAVIAEVQDAASPWTPYLDYYDAAVTPDPGALATVSFGGSFYDE